MHNQLHEDVPQKLEVFEQGNAYLKIRLKNKIPPLFLRVKYMKQPSDLTLYMSYHNIEPSEENHDGQPHYNVSHDHC